MSLQINLLKRTERRHQGIVSMKVMAFSSISLFAGITLLAALPAGISKLAPASDLERARREFEDLDPLATELRTVQKATEANRKTLTELNHWAGSSGPPMYSVLRSVQKNISTKMRLYHLFAGTEPTGENDVPAYTLRISGTATGELTAVETKRRLNADHDLRSFCGEIRLVSSRRHFDDSWAFALEGRRPVEEAK